MDYLDPKKKHAHKIRIFVGYGLFAVLIALATLLLVYVADGYYIDRNTGEVIQNGLVYVSSRPGGAEVYLNGRKQRGLTDERLVIPGNTYTIKVTKKGYRDWNRTIRLEGGTLRRLTYTKLIPKVLLSTVGVNLRSNPSSVSQSIDKRWLVISYADNPLSLNLIDINTSPIINTTIQIPKKVVTNSNDGRLKVVEWAGDNRHFLAKYSLAGSIEYLMVDKDDPTQSVNLNTLFASKSIVVGLNNRSNNKFFVYDSGSKELYIADVTNGLGKIPILKDVLAYRTFASDWILYVTSSSEKGLVEVRFKRGNKDILLKKLKTNSRYLLQLAKLKNAPIMAVSSPVEGRAIVYNDPQKYLDKNPNAKIPVATTVMRVPSITELLISTDSSAVFSYGPENFAAHEFRANKSYNYKTSVELDSVQEVRWADGQHIVFSAGGLQQIIDFDGSNQYKLVKSLSQDGSFYSKNLNTMYTFNPLVKQSVDTQSTPPRIMVTSLLIPKDR